MSKLILVRHGESQWNKKQVFTGWVDITLTRKGIDDTQNLARKLREIEFDIIFTSHLERAKSTAMLITSEQDKSAIFQHKDDEKYKINNHTENHLIPVFNSPALNERYYGLLQGLKKDEVRKKFGEEQVYQWRRSFKTRPPEGESLEDVYVRVTNFFRREIKPFLKENKNILISAHGNSLRALIKCIDKISDEDVVHLELAPGTMISYTIQENGDLTKDNGEHQFTRPLAWK